MNTTTLVLHGGCGLVFEGDLYKTEMLRITTEGQTCLQKGASSVEAVELCVSLLEDSPLFNAGKGSVLNAQGGVEMDAAIMCGDDLSCGAVAAVTGIKNPVRLARKVMDTSEHVLLIGEGANAFADTFDDIEKEELDYFLTKRRVQQLEEARKKGVVVLDHSSIHPDEKKFGTVGAVACDGKGCVAAATSTGGIVNKTFGRVGDSPLIGAGTWADNQSCAVSATGYGEQLIRSVIGKTTADLMTLKGLGVQEAAEQAVQYLTQRVQGLGGIIAVDAKGELAFAHSTPHMLVSFARGASAPEFHTQS